MANKVLDFTEARIKRADVCDAMKDFLRDMRAEFDDETVRDELALMRDFGTFEFQEIDVDEFENCDV